MFVSFVSWVFFTLIFYSRFFNSWLFDNHWLQLFDFRFFNFWLFLNFARLFFGFWC